MDKRYLKTHTAEQYEELKRKIKALMDDPNKEGVPLTVLGRRHGLSRYWVYKVLRPEVIEATYKSKKKYLTFSE